MLKERKKGRSIESVCMWRVCLFYKPDFYKPKVLGGLNRKCLTENVTCEQTPERSEEWAMPISGEECCRCRERRKPRSEAGFVAHCAAPLWCWKQSGRQERLTGLLTPPGLLLFLTKGFKPHWKCFARVINAFCWVN